MHGQLIHLKFILLRYKEDKIAQNDFNPLQETYFFYSLLQS